MKVILADELPDERGERQECPHGVDDGACKQCYGEATNALFCDLKTDEDKANFFLSGRGYETGVIAKSIQNDVAMAYQRCVGYAKEFAARAPTLTTERDAFENWWNAKLAAGEASIDIAFHMFVELTADSVQPQAAEPKQPPFDNCQFRICDLPGQCRAEGKCHHPAAQAAEPKGLTEEQLCAVQCAEEALRAIAERGYQIGDTIEPINDIRAASGRAAAALKRFAPVARALLSKGE